jgi:uncharacterized protein YjbI with pentapeptide repeats
MTHWVVDCTNTELQDILNRQFLWHSSELSIEQGDTIYLHNSDEATLVGALHALRCAPGDSDDTNEVKTVFRFEDDGPLRISTHDLPYGFSEGRLQPRKVDPVQTEFNYEGEPVELEEREEAGDDEGGGPPNDWTVPSDATLTDVLTGEYDVRDMDFSGQSAPPNQVVSDVVLRNCDFSDAELEGVTFRGADLRDSDFRGADLRRATFDHDVKIQGADFTKAKMSEATLATDVTASNFRLTVLNDSDLTKAALAGADFSESFLRRADFTGTNPERTDFRGATLQNIRTSKSTFEYCGFVNADLRGVDFGDCRVIDCDFVDARLEGADFSGADLSENDLTSAHMSGADFSGVDVEAHDFKGADLQDAKFEDASAEGASFQDARLTDADFNGAALVGARFVGVQADRTEFDSADLTGATFAQADLFGSSFYDSRLYGCHLASARVDSREPFDDICIYERETRGEDTDEATNGREPDTVTADEKAASVYRTLEAVMDSNSHTTGALRYFYLRKEALRRVHSSKGSLRQRVVDLFSRYVVDHGVRFRSLIGWALVVLVATAVAYASFGLLTYRGSRVSIGSSAFSVWETMGLTLLFSAYSFTGLGFGEFQPVGIGRAISVGETAVGILIFALFIYVFTTRASR